MRAVGEVVVAARAGVPADRVWQLLATPACWPAWSPQIRHVEAADGGAAPGRLAVGQALRLLTPVPGVHVPIDVVEVADGRSWAMEATLPVGRVRSDHRLSSGPDGTSVEVALRWLGPPLVGAPVLAAYRPAAALAVRRLLRLAAREAAGG